MHQELSAFTHSRREPRFFKDFSGSVNLGVNLGLRKAVVGDCVRSARNAIDLLLAYDVEWIQAD